MLGDSELDQLWKISDKYNSYKTILTGSKSPNFASYVSTPDMNMKDVEDGLAGLLNPDTSGLDTDSLINGIVGGFSSTLSGMGSVKLNVDNSKIKGKGPKGGLLQQLIQLILEIVKLPVRFGNLNLALMEATAALGVGIGGIFKSTALAAKDLGILIIAILRIFFKYFLCILSFIITTIGGCFLVHGITLFFVIIYLAIMYIVDKINDTIGIDFAPMVENAAQYAKWFEPINTICYTCFGKSVKLRDVIADVGVLEGIGNMISYDFNNTMPRYMKPSVPLGKSAMKRLDKAIK